MKKILMLALLLSGCESCDGEIVKSHNGVFTGLFRKGHFDGNVEILRKNSSLTLKIDGGDIKVCLDGDFNVYYFGKHNVWGYGDCERVEVDSTKGEFEIPLKTEKMTVPLKAEFSGSDRVKVSLKGVGHMWLERKEQDDEED